MFLSVIIPSILDSYLPSAVATYSCNRAGIIGMVIGMDKRWPWQLNRGVTVHLMYFFFTGFTRAKLVQSGTTSFLATVVFSDHPLSNKMDKLLQTLESHVGHFDGEGAVLEGIHSEVNK